MVWNEERIQVIKDLFLGKTNILRASIILRCSQRTVRRKMIQYQAEGDAAFVHGNKGKTPINKFNLESISSILEEKHLEECNFTELSRLLREYHGIKVSSSCLNNHFRQMGILSSKCTKSTRKKLKKMLKEKAKRENLTKIENQTLSALKKEELTKKWVHPTKPRSKYYGERIEMDASSLHWIRGLGKLTLHVAVDDASGHILGLWLEKEETLHGYYKVMEYLLKTFGVPLKLRTDKRTVFIYKKKGQQKIENDTMTQFAFACSKLGIELSCNSDPDSKPKVERMNQTLQGILPYRFSEENISDIDSANKYLRNKFIPWFNNEFGYDYDIINGQKRKIESVFDKCPDELINRTLVVLTERKINNGQTIKYNNEYKALYDSLGKPAFLLPKSRITVIKTLDNKYYGTDSQNNCYSLQTVPKRYIYSKDVDSESFIIQKPKKKRKIPEYTPWHFNEIEKFRQTDSMLQRLLIDA